MSVDCAVSSSRTGHHQYAFLSAPPPSRKRKVPKPTPPRPRAASRGASTSENSPTTAYFAAQSTAQASSLEPRTPLTPINHSSFLSFQESPSALTSFSSPVHNFERIYDSAWQNPFPSPKEDESPSKPRKRRQTVSGPLHPYVVPANLPSSTPAEEHTRLPAERTKAFKMGFFSSSPATDSQRPYVPKVAASRPKVLRPMFYAQDAALDEFFGDTRAMKGKKAHGTYGLPSDHADYGHEVNWVDPNGRPWRDPVDRQYHEQLLAAKLKAREDLLKAEHHALMNGTILPLEAYRILDRNRKGSNSDEDFLSETDSTGESLSSEIIVDRRVRTASAEISGYVPGLGRGEPAQPNPPSAYILSSKKPLPAGAEYFPNPSPPSHLHPESNSRQPRAHGTSRRRAAPPAPTTAYLNPVMPPDPIAQARAAFMNTSLKPRERESSRSSSKAPPVTKSAPSREGSCPPTRQASNPPTRDTSRSRPSASDASRQSAGRSSRDTSASRPPTREASRPPTRESMRHAPSPSLAQLPRSERALPPTIQSRHRPTHSTSSSSLKGFVLLQQRAASEDESAGRRVPSGDLKRTLTRSVSALFKKAKGN